MANTGGIVYKHTTKDTENEQKLAKAAVYLAVLSVSFSAIMIRYTTAAGISVAFYRMLFSWIMVLPLFYIKKAKLPPLKSKTFMYAALSGVFLGFHFATWITSVKYTTVANSATLVATQPFFVVVGSSVFLKEKIKKQAYLGIIIAFIGSVLLVYRDLDFGSTNITGDILAVVGAVFAAVYVMFGRYLRADLSVETYTFIVYGMSALTILAITVVSSPALLIVNSNDIIFTLLMALVCTMFGHSLFNWSLKYVSAAFVSVMILGEPIGSTVWASLLLKEIPGVIQGIACVILLTGIYLFTRYEKV